MIFLTAGHHKKDPGAVNEGLKESNLNLELVGLIIERAKQIDPNIDIWTDDFKDTLPEVISKVRSSATKEDVWIEIHFDSAENKEAAGSTAIVANNARARSYNIADRLLIIHRVLNTRNRGIITESKSNRGKLGMLSTAASSVLLEIEFMSNNSAILNYDKWKYWVADEIARVLIEIHNEAL